MPYDGDEEEDEIHLFNGTSVCLCSLSCLINAQHQTPTEHNNRYESRSAIVTNSAYHLYVRKYYFLKVELGRNKLQWIPTREMRGMVEWSFCVRRRRRGLLNGQTEYWTGLVHRLWAHFYSKNVNLSSGIDQREFLLEFRTHRCLSPPKSKFSGNAVM